MKEEDEFKKELQALLDKYDVDLSLEDMSTNPWVEYCEMVVSGDKWSLNLGRHVDGSILDFG